jgi:hypothetical protein
MKLLIIGHARHGKDTVGEMLQKNFGLTFKSSSLAASEIFIYDTLKEKYGYSTPEECFEDRVNYRAEWYDLICDYNSVDKAKLAKDILVDCNMYIGMRDFAEIQKCKEDGIFDFIIGVYNPRLPEESKDSFNIDLWKESDFVIPNSGTLEDLEERVSKIFKKLL